MKIGRHAKIVDLIGKYDIETQEELAEQLKREGYRVTQATISRDIFLSMDMAQNILVIKTVSGMAMAVAAAIDAMHWSEVAGCIAGDDTIMCAVRSVDDTLRVMDKISRVVGRK